MGTLSDILKNEKATLNDLLNREVNKTELVAALLRDGLSYLDTVNTLIMASLKGSQLLLSHDGFMVIRYDKKTRKYTFTKSFNGLKRWDI